MAFGIAITGLTFVEIIITFAFVLCDTDKQNRVFAEGGGSRMVQHLYPNDLGNSSRSVQDFIGQFTDLLNRGSGLSANGLYQPVAAFENVHVQPFSGYPHIRPSLYPHYPVPSYYFGGGNVPFMQYPPVAFPVVTQRPIYPHRPPVVINYPHQQQHPESAAMAQSLTEALLSIAKHDDLRCVPRLLCEVTAGSSKTSSGHSAKQSTFSLPFNSKNALVTFLTVLNFVDDSSPLLLFGRAGLLGYTSRGDPKNCINAYPTCPKDPNQLLNYLNNYKGGFFRFFNKQSEEQRRQQLPQHSQYAPTFTKQQTKSIDTNKFPSKKRNKYYVKPDVPHQYAAKNQKYITRRVINNPITVVSESDRLKLLPFNDHQTDTAEISNAIPSYQGHREPNEFLLQNGDDSTGSKYYYEYFDYYYQDDNTAAATTTTTGTEEKEKKFVFPDSNRAGKAVKSRPMIFPDRTGTGNLILDEKYGNNYKVIYSSESNNRGPKGVKFIDRGEDYRVQPATSIKFRDHK